jgi:hypothetical protein
VHFVGFFGICQRALDGVVGEPLPVLGQLGVPDGMKDSEDRSGLVTILFGTIFEVGICQLLQVFLGRDRVG